MKRHIALVLLLCFLVLPGCVKPTIDLDFQKVLLVEPNLNQPVEAGIGDTILSTSYVTKLPVINVTKKMVSIWEGVTIEPGYFMQIGEDELSTFYLPLMGDERSGVVILSPYRAIKCLRLTKADSKLSVISVFDTEAVIGVCEYEKQIIDMPISNSLSQSLIFNGRDGDYLKVRYREFSNSQQPVLNNDVQYNLKETSQILYKGAVIDIIDVNSLRLTYQVTKGFNRPEANQDNAK